MKRDKYITFFIKQIGYDGYKYIQNVKYRIWKETSNTFYLIGKNGKFLNRISKLKLRSRFKIGYIIRL